MVEKGGIILGRLSQDILEIDQLLYLPNRTTADNRYILAADLLDQYLDRPDLVGLFHTHQRLPWPGPRDMLSMQQLVKRLEQPLCLGIIKHQLRIWLFDPQRFWPRALTFQTKKELPFD